LAPGKSGKERIPGGVRSRGELESSDFRRPFAVREGTKAEPEDPVLGCLGQSGGGRAVAIISRAQDRAFPSTGTKLAPSRHTTVVWA
jgi:hypothetical protein